MLSSEWAATRSKWAAPTRGEAHAEQGKGEHEVDGEQRGTAREGRLEASVDAALGGPPRAHVEVLEYALLPRLHEGHHLVVLVRGTVEANVLEATQAGNCTVRVLLRARARA